MRLTRFIPLLVLTLLALASPARSQTGCTYQSPFNSSSSIADNATGAITPADARNARCSALFGVDIKAFGATGNGSTDDTTAIQAAIDYAYNNHLQGIFCPDGSYKTTRPLYLDAPGNLRGNLANPTIFAFSLAFVGTPNGLGNHEGFGCQIKPTFNDNVALWVGTGQGMHVSNVQILGPSGGYRGNQSSAGVGIGIAGGSGGASKTLIENSWIENFFACLETGANGNQDLADSNSFRNFTCNNAYEGVWFNGNQNDINDVQEPRITATIAINSDLARPVTVIGGDLSATSGVSDSFTISSVSALAKGSCFVQCNYSFTATIASPDSYVGTVYNSYIINTAHFGLIPLTLTSYNSGTGAATFQLWFPWTVANYGYNNLTTVTDISNEIQAVTTLYAVERVTTFYGTGIHAIGAHIENPLGCTTFIDSYTGFGGATWDEADNAFFNFDPGMTPYKPANSPTNAQLALFYCAQSFPFIYQENGQGIVLNGGYYGQNYQSEPVIIDIAGEAYPSNQFVINNIRQSLYAPNVRISLSEEVSITNNYVTLASVGHGAGIWDETPFVEHAQVSSPNDIQFRTAGEVAGPYCGFRPCPWTTPSLSPDLYSLVSGSLGALGSYPAINSETIYRSVNWNSTTLKHLHVRSASGPGFSYGQNFTNATTGGKVSWSYKGKASIAALDATTLSWMFAGLGISINNGSGPESYIVTGVYPAMGYISVLDASADTHHSQTALLAGAKTAIYSCSSICTIGQAPYSWTAYP